MSNLKNADLTLTENAINKIKHLINQEDADSLLYLSVSGGGCSGFQYNFNIANINTLLADDEDEDDDYDFLDDDDDEYDDDEDEIEAKSKIKFSVFDEETGKPLLLVDQASNNLLKHSIIDYVEDINGSRFTVNNPIAKSKCGCGNSFSI